MDIVMNYIRAKRYREELERQLAKAVEVEQNASEALRSHHAMMLMPITVLDMPEDTFKRLNNAGIVFVYELARLGRSRLPKGIGDKTYESVRKALKNVGIKHSFS